MGEGSGDLLSVSLELPDRCHTKAQAPLASAPLHLAVQGTADWKQDRKKERRRRKERTKGKGSIKSVDMGDISEILSNIALRDENSRGGDPGGPHPRSRADQAQADLYGHEATTLEVGMYVLLGIFCVAISVFMASCFVYASKQQQTGGGGPPFAQRSRSVQNAHDWVWLGRHTLDKSSVGTSGSKDMLSSSLR